MAVYYNYEIPKKIPLEDEFIYDLKDKVYWNRSVEPFLLGEILKLMESIKNEKPDSGIVDSVNSLYKNIENYFSEYSNIYSIILKEWERKGRPLSLKAHQALKSILDKEDEIKEMYYDR